MRIDVRGSGAWTVARKLCCAVVLGCLGLYTTRVRASDRSLTYVDNGLAAHFSLLITVPGGYCTGVLIADDVALTAAHCLKQEKLVARDVGIGFSIHEDQRRRGGVPYLCRGQALSINPLWGTSKHPGMLDAYDMGIIKFSCPNPPDTHPADINYGDVKALISLHPGQYGTEPFPLFSAGYGRIASVNPDSTHDAALEIADRRLKIRTVDVKALGGMDGEAIATMQGSRGFICHGDSGGALFAEEPQKGSGLLFGINTRTGWGAGCTTTSFAARLDTNYDWLRSAMIAVGSNAPIPERGSGASECAATRLTSHRGSDPPFQELTTANRCVKRIWCSTLGWMLLSSGSRIQFNDHQIIEPGGDKTFKIFTHDPNPEFYAKAICDDQ